MNTGSSISSTEHLAVTRHKVWYEHEEFSWGTVHGVDIWRYEESELKNSEELAFLENQKRYRIVPPHWDGDETFVCRIENRLIEVTSFRVLSAVQSG